MKEMPRARHDDQPGPRIKRLGPGHHRLGVDDFIGIPHCPDYLSPILTAIPQQLLAYHTAVALGCDVDKPRNLAKSVTVE